MAMSAALAKKWHNGTMALRATDLFCTNICGVSTVFGCASQLGVEGGGE